VSAASFGRPSLASSAPWRLRDRGGSSDAGVRAESGDLPGWALRAATVTGVRHRLAGLGNDDAFAWRVGAPALMVAVADGVGSVAGSGSAAALAVAAAVGPAADGGGLPALAAANRAVAEREGATTLVVAVIGADGVVEATRVGDSSAFVLDSGRWRECFAMGPGDDDAVVSTATVALPSPEPKWEAVAFRLVPGQALILVTDGVANPLRDGPDTVAPALAAALASPPEAIVLAGMVDFSRQGCHDDRTLLGIWPRSDAGASEPSW